MNIGRTFEKRENQRQVAKKFAERVKMRRKIKCTGTKSRKAYRNVTLPTLNLPPERDL